MANFKFQATILVTGVRSKKDAINELQIMLDDYDDMNPDDSSIMIKWDAVEKTPDWDLD